MRSFSALAVLAAAASAVALSHEAAASAHAAVMAPSTHLLQVDATRDADQGGGVGFYGISPAAVKEVLPGKVQSDRMNKARKLLASGKLIKRVDKAEVSAASTKVSSSSSSSSSPLSSSSFYGIASAAPSEGEGVRAESVSAEASTVTKSKSWFDRMRKSLVGVLIGLVMLIVAPVALVWGELWYVTQTRFLGRARDSTVANVTTSELRRSLDGRLVHMAGAITTVRGCADADTGVKDDGAVRLARKVEVYQWHEDRDESKEETTFRYELRWSEEDIDSSEFEQPTGHRNPPRAKPLYSQPINAPDARLGVLGCDEVLGAMEPAEEAWCTVALSPEYIFFPDAKGPDGAKAGDVRVSYKACSAPCAASVVAVQDGERLRAFTPRDVNLGDDTPSMVLLERGDVSKTLMFSKGQGFLRMVNWAVRVVGFLLIAVGIYLLLHPVAELISFLPLLDGLLKHAFALFALLAALVLAPLFVALGWVYARPLAASAVFAAVGGVALAAQGGFATTGAIVSVSVLWGIATVELLLGCWQAFSDHRHREEMRRQIQELQKEDAHP